MRNRAFDRGSLGEVLVNEAVEVLRPVRGEELGDGIGFAMRVETEVFAESINVLCRGCKLALLAQVRQTTRVP